MGVSGAFVALVVQNASINVLAKITRTGSSAQLYAPSTLVIQCEALKILLSLLFAAAERRNATPVGKRVGLRQSANEVLRDIFVVRRSELARAALPSLLYAVSNNLS